MQSAPCSRCCTVAASSHSDSLVLTNPAPSDGPLTAGRSATSSRTFWGALLSNCCLPRLTPTLWIRIRDEERKFWKRKLQSPCSTQDARRTPRLAVLLLMLSRAPPRAGQTLKMLHKFDATPTRTLKGLPWRGRGRRKKCRC